jgi:hypothetical protein
MLIGEYALSLLHEEHAGVGRLEKEMENLEQRVDSLDGVVDKYFLGERREIYGEATNAAEAIM